MLVYADNAATTKISKSALDAMMPIFETYYGNPSSLHTVGQEAAEKLLESPFEKDKVFRAWGILRNARVLSGDEFMELASLLRMGISIKTVDFDITKLNELSFKVQPATINAIEGRELSSQDRDIVRADWVRKAFQ